MMRRVFLLTILPFTAALAAGAAPPVDPWTRVPELPTACYQDQDGFTDAVEQSIANVSEELDRQTEINQELAQRMQDQDPMAKRQAMVDFMRQHPEDA